MVPIDPDQDIHVHFCHILTCQKQVPIRALLSSDSNNPEKSMIRIFPILLSLFLILSCSNPRPLEKDIAVLSYWPTAGWESSPPEEQGLDSERLADLLRFIRQNGLGIHSLLLIRNGRIVLDAYFYPFTPGGTVHDVASVTKSVISALTGIAIDKGYISSVDQPMLSLLPKRTIPDIDRKKSVTIKDLLTMRSGFDCGLLPGERELYDMLQTGNYVQSVIELPMALDPGSKYAYCSGNMHLLSAIITEATGLSALDFAKEHLFAPIGIQQVFWPSDAQGVTHGWGDLHLHPHDMARIGYLYLKGGMWEGRQIVSSQWIEQTVQPHSALSETEGYGYGWWLQSISPTDHLFFANGRGGQNIYVWPAKDIVVVLTGGGYDIEKIQQPLLSTIQSDGLLPENQKDNKRLQDMLATITRPPEPKPVPPLPETAKRISGKRYLLEKNTLNFKAISLKFDGPKEGVVEISRITNSSGETADYVLPIGLNGVYPIIPGGLFGLPWGAKGHWKSPDVFVLHWDFIANINRFRFTLSFAEEMVTIALDEETGLPGEVFRGYAKKQTP